MRLYCFAHVGQSLGQSVDQVLSAQYVLTPFLIVTKLGTVMVLESIFSLLNFISHGQRSKLLVIVKIKLLFFIPSFVLNSQYIIIVLPYIYQTFYNGCIRGQELRSLLHFRSFGQRSRSNLLSYSKVNYKLFV